MPAPEDPSGTPSVRPATRRREKPFRPPAPSSLATPPISHPIVFITGTDTGAGKTVLATLLVRHLASRGLRIAAFKPLCSGSRSDARLLRQALPQPIPLDRINPWHFRRPLAPLLAAQIEGRQVRLASVLHHIQIHSRHADLTVVEGAGGLLSPLGSDFDSRDLLLALNALPVIVCPNRLGAVNQARLALEALPPSQRQHAIVVLVQPHGRDRSATTNASLLAQFHPAHSIATLPWISHQNRPDLSRLPGLRPLLRHLPTPPDP